MLDYLAVDLQQYSFTANCSNCLSILFQIRIIDEFIRQKTDEINGLHGAKYYLLHDLFKPSTLQLDKIPYINKTKPFTLLYLLGLNCCNCGKNVGFKLLSTSSEMSNSELLGRFFIDVIKVKIKTEKQDVTNQLFSKFQQQWNSETDYSSIQFSEVKFKKKQCEDDQVNEKEQQRERQKKQQKSLIANRNKKRRNSYKLLKQQKKMVQKQVQVKHEEIKKQRQLSNIKRQLQLQNLQNKEVIHQIISSVDFFVQVLESLEKRVAQVETVCTGLKDKIEKIVPLLRKKNNES